MEGEVWGSNGEVEDTGGTLGTAGAWFGEVVDA